MSNLPTLCLNNWLNINERVWKNWWFIYLYMPIKGSLFGTVVRQSPNFSFDEKHDLIYHISYEKQASNWTSTSTSNTKSSSNSIYHFMMTRVYSISMWFQNSKHHSKYVTRFKCYRHRFPCAGKAIDFWERNTERKKEWIPFAKSGLISCWKIEWSSWIYVHFVRNTMQRSLIRKPNCMVANIFFSSFNQNACAWICLFFARAHTHIFCYQSHQQNGRSEL